MLKPNKYLKELGIDEKYWLFKEAKSGDERYQENEDGFVPAEMWNLDGTFAMYIYSHLCYFRDHCNIGHPGGMSSEQWNKCLDDMIAAFKLLVQEDEIEDYEDYKSKQSKNKEKKIKYGLRLFAKHMRSLWY